MNSCTGLESCRREVRPVVATAAAVERTVSLLVSALFWVSRGGPGEAPTAVSLFHTPSFWNHRTKHRTTDRASQHPCGGTDRADCVRRSQVWLSEFFADSWKMRSDFFFRLWKCLDKCPHQKLIVSKLKSYYERNDWVTIGSGTVWSGERILT